MAELISREAFKVIEGRPVTSSIKVAEYFDKPHSDVLKSIRRLIDAKADFSREGNFSLTEEINQLGATTRKVPFYWMDRKGFSILAMGFTGAKALDFKCAFYDEFERMEKALHPTCPVAATLTIDAAQQLAIRNAVARRAKNVAVHYQTIYRALYERFQIPRYNELRRADFDDAIRFIETCEIRPQLEAAPRLPEGSVVLSSQEADQLLTLIYYVRFLFRDAFDAVYQMMRVAQSPIAGHMYDAFHEVPWGRMLDILARHGHDINDLPCYQHWLKGRAA